MPRKSRKSIFTKFAEAFTGKKKSRGPSDSDVAGTSVQDDPITPIVQTCMDLTHVLGRFVDPIPQAQIDALPLPSALIAEKCYRDRDNAMARARYTSVYQEICNMINAADEHISEAREAGEDLSMFERHGRGIASEYTKYDIGGRRDVLDWSGKKPVGPGDWATHFNAYIGILVCNTAYWNIGFTFSEQSWETYVWTWQTLLAHFVLEDYLDLRWEYVRAEMHGCFKRWRERLKKKYIKSNKFSKMWQKFAGLPSNINREEFAFCLWYWDTDEAKTEATRNSANRAKVRDDYFGGTVPVDQYRHTMGEAGYWSELSHTWGALHTKECMEEEKEQIATQHQYHLEEAERSYRESNPELPSRDPIPLEDEVSIIEQEFSRSKAHGRIPVHGGPLSLTRSGSTRKTKTPTSSSSKYSDQAREIQMLQEQLRKRDEADAAFRAQAEAWHMEEMAWRSQMMARNYAPPPQDPHYPPPPQSSYYPPPTQGAYYQPPPLPPSQYPQFVSPEELDEFRRYMASKNRPNDSSGGS